MTRVAIDIRKVPADVRAAVDADARARGLSREAVVAEILAAKYKRKWEPTGYPHQPLTDTDHWNIRVPLPVKNQLVRDKERRGGTITGLVLYAIREHYGLPNEPPTRRSTGGIDEAIVTEARQRHQAGESIRSLSRHYRVKRETLTKAIRG